MGRIKQRFQLRQIQFKERNGIWGIMEVELLACGKVQIPKSWVVSAVQVTAPHTRITAIIQFDCPGLLEVSSYEADSLSILRSIRGCYLVINELQNFPHFS